MPAVAVRTADEAVAALERAVAEPGPHLIDAVLELRDGGRAAVTSWAMLDQRG